MEELCEALQCMPNKNVQGPYNEFYKEFWPILAPAFQRIYTEVKETCPSSLLTWTVQTVASSLSQIKTLHLTIVQDPLWMQILKSSVLSSSVGKKN